MTIEGLTILGEQRRDAKTELAAVDDAIHLLITEALERGEPWSAIGKALGVDRATAHRSYYRRR